MPRIGITEKELPRRNGLDLAAGVRRGERPTIERSNRRSIRRGNRALIARYRVIRGLPRRSRLLRRSRLRRLDRRRRVPLISAFPHRVFEKQDQRAKDPRWDRV